MEYWVNLKKIEIGDISGIEAYLLHTNKNEGEEFLLYKYPEETTEGEKKSLIFECLKGVIVASTELTPSILGEPARMLSINQPGRREEVEVNERGYFSIGMKLLSKEICLAISLPSRFSKSLLLNLIDLTSSLLLLIIPINKLLTKIDTQTLSAIKHIISWSIATYTAINSTTPAEFWRGNLGKSSIFYPNIMGGFIPRFISNDKLQVDLCEILNALYDDHHTTNQILTTTDSSTFPRGSALFYGGMVLISTLQAEELLALYRTAAIYQLLEREANYPDQVIVQRILLGDKFGEDENKKDCWNVAVIVCNGECMLGAVIRVISKMYTEFDPFFIQRIKHALLIMREKGLIEGMKEELSSQCIRTEKQSNSEESKRVRIKLEDTTAPKRTNTESERKERWSVFPGSKALAGDEVLLSVEGGRKSVPLQPPIMVAENVVEGNVPNTKQGIKQLIDLKPLLQDQFPIHIYFYSYYNQFNCTFLFSSIEGKPEIFVNIYRHIYAALVQINGILNTTIDIPEEVKKIENIIDLLEEQKDKYERGKRDIEKDIEEVEEIGKQILIKTSEGYCKLWIVGKVLNSQWESKHQDIEGNIDLNTYSEEDEIFERLGETKQIIPAKNKKIMFLVYEKEIPIQITDLCYKFSLIDLY